VPDVGGGQILPQVPQLFVSVCSLTHAVPQSDGVGAEQPRLHTPPLHPADPVPAVGGGQIFPQVPQLLVSVIVFVHSVLLQSVCPPVVQVVTHPPSPLQLDVAFMTVVEHACPHMPQLLLSPRRFTQTPLHTILPVPVHPTMHTPLPLQLEPVAQACPHMPQLLLSFVVSTHAVPQFIQAGLLHWVTHPPPLQTAVAAVTVVVHACPHVPQLVLSLVVSTQAEPHCIWPVGHVVTHPPPLQLLVAPATVVEHACPHIPQLFLSPIVSTHAVPQAVGVTPEQATVHAPAAHAGNPAPAVGGAHAVPQPPQFFGSAACVSRQRPLQSVSGVGHAHADDAQTCPPSQSN
jgi:hypothetical protein